MVEPGNLVLWSAWRPTRPSTSRACMWPIPARNLCSPCCPNSRFSAQGLAAPCSLLAAEPCLALAAGPNWTWTSLATSLTCVTAPCPLPRLALLLDGQMEPTRTLQLRPPRPPPSTTAVRRVDVRPLPTSPAQPCPSPGTAASSPARPPGLQRSKSDLSECFSRAAADLERFFNFCGLDPEEARGLGVAHLARANSDIVSLAGPSAGPGSSEGGCSHRSSATVEERALERVPYGVSVVERNARVIKWLYGLRQARETPAAEG